MKHLTNLISMQFPAGTAAKRFTFHSRRHGMRWRISLMQIGFLAVVHALAADGNAPAEDRSDQQEESALIIGLSSSSEEVSSVVQQQVGNVGVTTVTTPSGTRTITSVPIGNATVHNLSKPTGESKSETNAPAANPAVVHALAVDGNASAEEGSDQQNNAALIVGLSSSDTEVSSVVQQQVGDVDVATVVTSSGTATVTSAPIGNTTVHNLSSSSGESISGTSARIGNTTVHNFTGSGGNPVSATTQSIGNVQITTGSSGKESFSAITQKVGNTNITIVTTPSGTSVGTSTQVGNTTVHNFTSPLGKSDSSKP